MRSEAPRPGVNPRLATMPASVAALDAELRRTRRLLTPAEAARAMGCGERAPAPLVDATTWLPDLYETDCGRLGLVGVTVEEPPRGALALVEALRGGPVTRRHAARLIGARGGNVTAMLAKIRVWFPAMRLHDDGTLTLEGGA